MDWRAGDGPRGTCPCHRHLRPAPAGAAERIPAPLRCPPTPTPSGREAELGAMRGLATAGGPGRHAERGAQPRAGGPGEARALGRCRNRGRSVRPVPLRPGVLFPGIPTGPKAAPAASPCSPRDPHTAAAGAVRHHQAAPRLCPVSECCVRHGAPVRDPHTHPQWNGAGNSPMRSDRTLLVAPRPQLTPLWFPAHGPPDLPPWLPPAWR